MFVVGAWAILTHVIDRNLIFCQAPFFEASCGTIAGQVLSDSLGKSKGHGERLFFVRPQDTVGRSFSIFVCAFLVPRCNRGKQRNARQNFGPHSVGKPRAGRSFLCPLPVRESINRPARGDKLRFRPTLRASAAVLVALATHGARGRRNQPRSLARSLATSYGPGSLRSGKGKRAIYGPRESNELGPRRLPPIHG